MAGYTREVCLMDTDIMCHVNGCEITADKYMARNPRRMPICMGHYDDRWELGLVDNHDVAIIR